MLFFPYIRLNYIRVIQQTTQKKGVLLWQLLTMMQKTSATPSV